MINLKKMIIQERITRIKIILLFKLKIFELHPFLLKIIIIIFFWTNDPQYNR